MQSSLQRPPQPNRSNSYNNPSNVRSPISQNQPQVQRPNLTIPPAPGLIRSRSTVHLPLYRRILFPHDDPSSNIPRIVRYDGGDEEGELVLINERLYNLIALALRAYILTWYSRYTPNRTFPSTVHKKIIYPILSSILTDIYNDPGRICYLLLVDLPIILRLHIRTYNQARESLVYLPQNATQCGGDGHGYGGQTDQDLDYGYEMDLGKRYNDRLPLLSMSPPSSAEEGNQDGYVISQLYLSTLSTSILNHYIKEKQPDGERLMTREIISRSILNSVIRRLVEKWFWYQIILKVLGEPRTLEDRDGDIVSVNEKFPSTSSSSVPQERRGEGRSITQIVLHWSNTLIRIFTSIWSITIHIITLYTASKDYGKKYQKCYEPFLSLSREILQIDGNGNGSGTWLRRIIWGGFEMVVGLFGPVLDRILPHLIHTHILTPKTSLKLIDLIESQLFPNGYPGPSPIDPTPAEIVILKRKVEDRLDEVIPNLVKTIFFPPSNHGRRGGRGTSDILGWLENRSCNSHLIAMILNNVVATLIPDLVIEGYKQPPIEVGIRDQGEDIERDVNVE